MSSSPTALKERIFADMKSAMRNKEKDRLQTIRLILAAIKQQEVDTREMLDDDDVAVSLILDKLVKQRRDSIKQYSDAGRTDLAGVEQAELVIIQEYLPEQLSDSAIEVFIAEALQSTGASSMQDMGKIMGVIKPKVQGRADMGKVSKLIKSRLT